MTLEDLDRLEQLRLKATQGPWVTDEGAVWAPETDEWVCEYAAIHDAAYLAALSPDVVGELVRLARVGWGHEHPKPKGCKRCGAVEPHEYDLLCPARHMCGLQGFGHIGDTCPGCDWERAEREKRGSFGRTGTESRNTTCD